MGDPVSSGNIKKTKMKASKQIILTVFVLFCFANEEDSFLASCELSILLLREDLAFSGKAASLTDFDGIVYF